MIELTTGEIAAIVDGRLVGDDVTIRGAGNDTRKLSDGQLYVAVKGERFDGHDYTDQALVAGARALLVERQLQTDIAQVVVGDCIEAMGKLAAAWRLRFSIPVIAITGSNGKTTVKEMVACIAGLGGEVLVTEGNLNNHIGVPLTLFRLNANQRMAVIEMGANHPGEIRYLTAMAKPDVSLINNAAAAHLQGFGSLRGVAETKGEIYQGLKADGCGVVNADDQFKDYWLGLLKGKRHICFSMQPASGAEVSGEYRAGADPNLHIKIFDERFECRLKVPGVHNAMNALAAAAVATAAGIDAAQIKKGLENMRAVSGRMEQLRGVANTVVINDSYNANPASLQAGLQWLSGQPGEKILVLGDMYELGDNAGELHRQAGETARSLHIDRVFVIGEFAPEVTAGFGDGARSFSDYDALIAALKPVLKGNQTVLVKGSRGMHMETITKAITVT